MSGDQLGQLTHSCDDGHDHSDIKDGPLDLAIVCLHLLHVVHLSQANVEVKSTDGCHEGLKTFLARQANEVVD